MCPFVERVRLCLASKNIKYQLCDLDLGKKTQWHLEINGGLVPILEFPDGTLLNETKVLMEYVEEAFADQGYKMLPDDPLERAKVRLAITKFEAIVMPLFGAMLRLDLTEEDVLALKANL